MLWMLASAFFCWLIFREIKDKFIAPKGFSFPDDTPIFKSYVLILLIGAVGCAWPPFSDWQTERKIARVSKILADGRTPSVHCNTLLDTMLDRNQMAAAHANIETGEIVLQKPWCSVLRTYLAHPAQANRQELAVLNLVTHEAMHIRGETVEANTECQAVQRNYRTARLLGVRPDIARRNARDYYQLLYKMRGEVGGFQSGYFSEECAPGKALDERLVDSSWN